MKDAFSDMDSIRPKVGESSNSTKWRAILTSSSLARSRFVPPVHQRVLNGVGDGVDAVDLTLDVGVVALVQIGLSLQLWRVKLAALVRLGQGPPGFWYSSHNTGWVRTSPSGPSCVSQDVGRHVEGRGETLVNQVTQVEDGAAGLSGSLLLRRKGNEWERPAAWSPRPTPDHYPAGLPLQKCAERLGRRCSHGPPFVFKLTPTFSH